MKYPLELKVLDVGFQAKLMGEKSKNGWLIEGVMYKEKNGFREIENYKFHLKETPEGFVFIRGKESDMDELVLPLFK